MTVFASDSLLKLCPMDRLSVTVIKHQNGLSLINATKCWFMSPNVCQLIRAERVFLELDVFS